MVFVMKHINYLFLLISLSFLYALLITTNSPLTLQTHSWVYATEQEDNNQDNAQSSSENEDGPDQVNSESESSKGAADSDQSESNSNRNDDNDLSSTNQNTSCPNITEISNLPLYIGQDGCQYPCPSLDSNDQDNVPDGCPVEPSSQTNTGFSVKEENPTQMPSQEEQPNSKDSSNQNAFVSPSINSDTSTAVSNNEAPTTTTQKSFTPLGKLRGGPTQTESSIPLLSNDLSKPFTPGGDNPQVEGIPNQPNTNPQTPLNPGNVPTNIPAKGYVTVITKVLGFYNGVQASNFEVCVDSTVTIDGKEHNTGASPPCATGSGLGFKYTVQAPGNIGIAVNNLRPVSYMVEHPLSMDIAAYESKTFTIYITPYPSE